MVAANETILNRRPCGFASRRRRSLCRSVISVADRPVDCVAPTCRRGDFPLSVAAVASPDIRHKTHFTHHSLFHYFIERSATLRSPPLPRGSNNVVSLSRGANGSIGSGGDQYVGLGEAEWGRDKLIKITAAENSRAPR